MDGLRDVLEDARRCRPELFGAAVPGAPGAPGVPGAPGLPGSSGLPFGVTEAKVVRLFGAAYRMLGSAGAAREVVHDAVRDAVGSPVAADVGGVAAAGEAGPHQRLVREVVRAAGRRGEPGRSRRDGHAHLAAWLPDPVLTAAGVLGPMDTPERRESVSMARLVLLERLAPGERAAYVLGEVFGYRSAEAAPLLGVPEAVCRAMRRRARHRILQAEGVARTTDGEPQRWAAVAELLRAIREEDAAALEELLTEDVVAWSDGGGQPGVVRRPVLGTAKVGRFLAAVRGRIPEGARGHVAEVNGDAALVAVAGAEVVGVLAPEFGAHGMVGIRAVSDPARLVFVNRQWGDEPGPPASPLPSPG